jgi:hypothetical protein
LLFWGTEIIQQGTYKVRGKTTWQLNGRDISLEQVSDHEKVSKHLSEFKDVAVTCELKCNGAFREATAITELFEDLQNLFSLASANFVTTMYEDRYFNGVLSATLLFPLKTYSFSTRPSLIDLSIHGTRDFKDFIEITFPNYINYKNNLGLSYFIEFFTTSKMYSPLEVEYILSTTAFECLESYFTNWQGLLEIRNNLKAKITRMCGHFGFTVTDSILEPYRDCRNTLSHTGKFPTGSDNINLLMTLRNLMDRFVLTILGYRNKPYFNAITRNKEMVP